MRRGRRADVVVEAADWDAAAKWIGSISAPEGVSRAAEKAIAFALFEAKHLCELEANAERKEDIRQARLAVTEADLWDEIDQHEQRACNRTLSEYTRRYDAIMAWVLRNAATEWRDAIDAEEDQQDRSKSSNRKSVDAEVNTSPDKPRPQ